VLQKRIGSHRFLWEFDVGPIPVNKDLMGPGALSPARFFDTILGKNA